MPLLVTVGAFFVFGTIIGTNQDFFGMESDHKKNLPYKPATLRDRDKDLSKEWYIEWYAWDEGLNDLVRKRKKIPMSYQDVKSRTLAGNKMAAQVNKLLESGYHFKTVRVTALNPLLEIKDLVNALNYVINIVKPGLGSKTVGTYQSAVNKLEVFAGEARIMATDFTNQSSIHFRDYLITTLGNTPRTANNTLAHLGVLFSKYMERTGIKENPFKVKSLREQATNKNIALTDEDRITLETYMQEHEPELYFVTRFIYQAFIRPGELLKIRIRDINPDAGYITVHGLISKNGKTETAPIINSLKTEILKRVDFSKPDKYLFSLSMFSGYTECSKQVPFRRHEKVLKHLGLDKKGYTLYSWKHTGAVNAYLAGVGLKELQNMLRHSSVQITDIYLKSLGMRTDPKLQDYNW
jgi:integrase